MSLGTFYQIPILFLDLECPSSQMTSKALKSVKEVKESGPQQLKFSLFSKLSVQIIRKVLHAFLELFLEVIKRLVYVVHGFNGLFLILLDFAKRIKKLINL